MVRHMGVIKPQADVELLRATFKSRRIGVECKRANAPTLTLSMRIALADLLRLCVIARPSPVPWPLI